jgi:CHAD domain-containing protein
MAKAKKIKWDETNGPAENARKQLPKIAKAYFAEVREVLAEDPAPAELHALRLASKRFRYSLELFRACYAAGLEERIERLKGVQDLLGDCNDAVASIPRLEKALRSEPVERERVRKYLEDLAAEKAAEFRKQWVESFDAPGQQQWWTGYLARNARPPSKGK